MLPPPFCPSPRALPCPESPAGAPTVAHGRPDEAWRREKRGVLAKEHLPVQQATIASSSPTRRSNKFAKATVKMGNIGGVPRGCVPVLVCDDSEGEQFVVRVEAQRLPSFAVLLEMRRRSLGTSKRASSGLRVPATSTTSRKFLPPPPGRALLDTDRSNRSPHGSEPNMLITH